MHSIIKISFFVFLCTLTSVVFLSACKITPTDQVDVSLDRSSQTSDESLYSSGPASSEVVSDTNSGSSEIESESISEDISENTSESNYSSSLSEASMITPEPTCTPLLILYVKEGIANLRTGPSTDHEIIKQLGFGASIKYISTSGEWMHVISAGETYGYIHSSLLSETKPDPSDYPIVKPVPEFPEWPAEYSLTGLYDPDLDQYIGRYKGESYFPLEGITVIVDPGHGGIDPGAVYFNPNTGKTVYEKTFNLEISLKLAEELEAMGATVIMTRETDEYVGLYKRNAIINKAVAERILSYGTLSDEDAIFLETISSGMQMVIDENTDHESFESRGIMHGIGVSSDFRKFLDISAEVKDIIFVSVHCNSYPQDTSVKGTEIYYGHSDSIRDTEEKWLFDEPEKLPVNPSYFMYDHDSREKLAIILRDKMSEGTDLVPRECGNENLDLGHGVFRGDYCVLRENNITGILLEVGFLTNADDRGFFSEPAGQRRIAYAAADGIYEYFCMQ